MAAVADRVRYFCYRGAPVASANGQEALIDRTAAGHSRVSVTRRFGGADAGVQKGVLS
jgi:hypothetical protein